METNTDICGRFGHICQKLLTFPKSNNLLLFQSVNSFASLAVASFWKHSEAAARRRPDIVACDVALAVRIERAERLEQLKNRYRT